MKKATIKHLRGSRLMMHARSLSKADDRLRDYLEAHEPSITIIDHPYSSHELLVKTEVDNAILVCVRQYCFDIPNFTHVFMDWDFPVEQGIIYRKDCRPEVKDFIDMLKHEIKENDL